MDDRKEFLLKMYDQMMNDINTHILVVWQSVGVAVGAFAIFGLTEKNIVPIDVAAALQVILSCWLLANLYDAAYWYNRNLVIIANIERQFLGESDLKEIHYYFGKHRAKTSMLTHLRIQWWLGVVLATLFLVYHLLARVTPGLRQPFNHFELVRTLPYLSALLSFILLRELRDNRRRSYEEFIMNSPGKEIRIEGIQYGVGHPIEAPGRKNT